MSSNKDQQESLVDKTGALQRLGGDRQLFSEFITIFLEDSPELIANIRKGLETNDATTVEKNAHSLKGLISNFGAKECVELALKLELAGRAGSVEDCDDDLDTLEQLHYRLTKELQAFQT